jgi:hypothetical protein
LPIILAFGYALVTGRQAWALKPFLGSAYLFYMLAGIGIGSIQFAALRRCFGVVIMAVAAVSLLPYYTSWQKSTSANAFHALPRSAGQNGVIVEPSYLSPLVFYYTQGTIPTYGIVAEPGAQASLVRILPTDKSVLGIQQRIPCDELSSVTALWIYEYNDHISAAIHDWPSCITTKQLWAFQGNQWRQLPP